MNDITTLKRPLGVTVIGLIFLFGVFMSAISAISLLNPGSFLEPMWLINPHARSEFAHLGICAPILLSLVCISCITASFGILSGRKWGYWFGITMLAMNLLGDLVNGLSGLEPRAWVGVPIVSLLLWYLSSARVKAFFRVTLARGA